MSSFTDQIDAHQFHSYYQTVLGEMKATEELENKPAEDFEALARISVVLENFNAAYTTCEKNLIALPWLTDAANALSNIASYLNSYRSSRDVTYLITHTYTQLDALLLCTTRLNCVRSRQSLRGVTDATTQYRRMMELHLEEAEKKMAAFSEDLEKFKITIGDNKANSTQILTELQNQIASEKQRLDQFSISYQAQMNTDYAAFNQLTESFQSAFKTQQENNKALFSEVQEKNEKEHKEKETLSANALATFSENGERIIKEYQAKFEEYKQQVENIVGIVNTNMFSHKYKEVADDAHKRAKFWHFIAVLLMILVGGFAVYAFVITTNADTSWVKLIAKIFATTTLVTGAAYSARQASKQEKVERYARKIEMELVSIDPFIESLSEEKRSLIKVEVSRKIFGNTDAMEISNKDEAYTAFDKISNMEKTMNTILSLVGKLGK